MHRGALAWLPVAVRVAIESVLERFDRMTRSGRAERLLAGRRPPATDAELDELRAAVDPWSLPEDVMILLRWSNGWADHTWPPAFGSGGVDPLPFLTHSYLQMRDEPQFRHAWNPLWLPLFHESWTLGSIELLPEGQSVVIHTNWGDDQVTVTAPSLAAELDAVADLLDAGLLDETRNRTPRRRAGKTSNDGDARSGMLPTSGTAGRTGLIPATSHSAGIVPTTRRTGAMPLPPGRSRTEPRRRASHAVRRSRTFQSTTVNSLPHRPARRVREECARRSIVRGPGAIS